jgi:hypothetical protein
MAELATLTAMLQQMTIQNNQHAVAMEDMRRRSAQEIGVLQQGMTDMQVAMAKAVTRPVHRPGIVDVKGVGKPDKLQGKTKDQVRKNWPNWVFTMQTWFGSQWQYGSQILDWAESETKPITRAVMADTALQEPDWDEISELNAQLHVALVSLCSDEALVIVRNSEKAMGLDAWRRLWREYDPNNAVSNFRLLRSVISPKQVTIGEVRGAVEEWQRKYKEYSERTTETLPDSVQRSCIQSICPEHLQDHLDLHTVRVGTFALMMEEIDQYLVVKYTRDMGGATPMDVDSMYKGGKGKGKSKGKGGAKFEGTCNNCGKKGHKKTECWTAPGADQSKGKAKGGPDKTKIECYNCGKKGHTKAECWSAAVDPKHKKGAKGKGKGKGVHALEEQGWPTDEVEPEKESGLGCLFMLREEGDTEGQFQSVDSAVLHESQSVDSAVLHESQSVDSTVLHAHPRQETTSSAAAGATGTTEQDRQRIRTLGHREEAKAETGRTGSSAVGVRMVHQGLISMVKANAAEQPDRAAELTEQAKSLNDARVGKEWNDPRLKSDVASGMSIKLAKSKYKSRMRAGKFRQTKRHEMAVGDVGRALKYQKRIDASEANLSLKAKFKDSYGLSAGKFDGDRADLKPSLVRAEIAPWSKNKYKAEDDEEHMPDVKPRSREKPAWMKGRVTLEARQKHNKKRSHSKAEKQKWLPDNERICFGFKRGHCKFGERCRFKHEGPAPSASQSSRDVPIHIVDDDDDDEYIEVEVEDEEASEEAADARSEWTKVPAPPWRKKQDLKRLREVNRPCPKPKAMPRSQGASAFGLYGELCGDDDEVEQVIMSVEPAGEFERIDATIDSGSAVHGIPMDVATSWPMYTPTGVQSYTSASQHAVKVVGARRPTMHFQSGISGPIEVKVLDQLKKVLFSTARMVEKGYRIVHDSEADGGSYALHKASGAKTKIYMKNGVFVMPVWIAKHPGGEATSFPGQVKP